MAPSPKKTSSAKKSTKVAPKNCGQTNQKVMTKSSMNSVVLPETKISAKKNRQTQTIFTTILALFILAFVVSEVLSTLAKHIRLTCSLKTSLFRLLNTSQRYLHRLFSRLRHLLLWRSLQSFKVYLCSRWYALYRIWWCPRKCKYRKWCCIYAGS